MESYKNLPGLLKFSNLGLNITHFITTRQTPLGQGDCFNIGFSGGETNKIIENRLILAKALNINPNCFVFQNQIHSKNSHYVTENDKGKGFYSKEDAIKNCDILYTNKPGLMLITRSADCIPVLIHDPIKHAIAAIHSGREGTFLGASEEAVDCMQQMFECKPENMLVGIGPGICQNCYEIDQECGYKFTEKYDSNFVKKLNGKIYPNLKKIIAHNLINKGVKPQNIEISNLCTKENSTMFFSARNGNQQRFCAGIMLNNNF